MKLRGKILFGGIGLMAVAMLLLGVMMIRAHRATYLEEAELRARAFLSMLAVASRGPVASGSLEDLDSMLASLIEHDLDLLDIQFVSIVDTNRRVIGHTDTRHYGTRPSDPFIIDAVAATEPLVRRIDNDDLLLVSMPMDTAVPGKSSIRWGTVVAGIGLERVRSGLVELFLRAVPTILIFVGLVTLLVGWRLERSVIRPVRELTASARAFAGGNLDARASIESDDELAVLCETFNRMSDQIARYTRQLEDEIRARTRELEEANRQLEALAITDALTGMFNRRYFEEALDKELRRCQRVDSPLSLLMMDVDHFKLYNDRHGHQAGDDLLRRLAKIVQRRVRETDMACRYGGEEFTIILPGTTTPDALVVASQLRQMVEEHPFAFAETQPSGKVTVSIGVATFPDHAEDKAGLISCADKAMYLVKQGGRNGVRAAPSEPVS